jgi:hypothetical protein
MLSGYMDPIAIVLKAFTPQSRTKLQSLAQTKQHQRIASVLHGYGYTHRFHMGTTMGTGMGTRILTCQIPIPVAVPMTKKLDFNFYQNLS